MKAIFGFVATVLAAVILSGCGDSDAVVSTTAAPLALKSIVDTLVALKYPASPDVSEFVDGLSLAGLMSTLSGEGPFTVFVPTSEAFYALRMEHLGLLSKNADVMRYHVHSGSAKSTDLPNGLELSTLFADPISHNLTVSADGFGLNIISETSQMVNVTTADVVCTNGVIHIIDAVLIPTLPATTTTPRPTTTPHPMSIVETLLDDDSMARFVDFLELGGLWSWDGDGVLQGDGPFTIFVPTDAAYQGFEASLPTFSNPDDWDAFKSRISSYHVHPGLEKSTDLADGQSVSTLFHNHSLTVSKDGSAVNMISETSQMVRITTTDIECTNGVIHFIDAVMIPKDVPSATLLSV